MNPGGKLALVAATSAILGGLFTREFLPPSSDPDLGRVADPTAITFDPWQDDRSTLSASATLEAGDPRISLRQLAILAGRKAIEDPEEAVRRAAEIPGHESREIYLGEVLRVWGEQDGEAAAAFASEHFKGRELSDALYYIADGWAEVDPAAAAVWFRDHTDGIAEDDAIWEALESWGRKDPRAAFAWAKELDEYARANAMQGLAEGWAAVDPEGAAAAAMELRDTEYGSDLLVTVGMQWVDRDPEKATVWAMGLQDERLRAAVVYEITDLWARTEPGKAVAWVAAITDPGARETAEAGLAKGWSVHDPAGAAEWALGTIQPQERLDELVGDIFFNWTNDDPRSASRWLDGRPAGAEKDRILQTYSSMIAYQDPEAAVAWATRIEDAPTREQHLRDLLEELVAKYGDWARRQIRGYEIPETIKREFVEPGT